MSEASVDSLKSAAVSQSGLEDFGDDWFEQPLAAWAQDLAGPALNGSGRAFLTRLAITNLRRRLEVVDCLKRYPEIADVPIPPILYITGLERSGTTLLHNLLALHPGARALLRWELTRPVPPPECGTFRTDPRIAEFARRPIVASYCRQFGVVPEVKRITGTCLRTLPVREGSSGAFTRASCRTARPNPSRRTGGNHEHAP